MEVANPPEAARTEAFLSKCVSIDLEVDPKTNKIKSFAAVRSGSQKHFVFRGGNLGAALSEMDNFAEGAEFLLGHNIIHFDVHHLEAAKSGLRILTRPTIDTLWLNPLAFPRNPYHHLIKHYQDGRLQGDHVNDPALDAELTLTVLQNQIDMLLRLDRESPGALIALHWLTTTSSAEDGFDAVFSFVRGVSRPNAADAQAAIRAILEGQACKHQIEEVMREAERDGWSLAYALSWISVAGGDSVMPPWVRYQFPQASELVRKLRDTPCTDRSCGWCSVHNDPGALLKKWFPRVRKYHVPYG